MMTTKCGHAQCVRGREAESQRIGELAEDLCEIEEQAADAAYGMADAAYTRWENSQR